MPVACPLTEVRTWFRKPRVTRECVGAEFEFLVVDRRASREARYGGERGVEALLRRLVERGRSWKGLEEASGLIALERPDGATVTLEPGSQLELSTPPRRDALAIQEDLRSFVAEVRSVAHDLELALLGIGLNPFSSTDEVELVPKRRYRIMTDYLSRKGDLALDMMRRTLSVHCSFDWNDEEDAAEKTRVAFGVTPIVVAMFAHSSLEKLADNGFASFRWECWQRTDNDRCGLIPEAVEPGFGFDRYLERLLSLPLMFTLKDGVYRPAHGLPARDWFAGRWETLEGHEGLSPAPEDLEWIINQSYRDVRLRRYLECRAADFPPPSMAVAPVALWTGLLYHPPSRRAAWEMVESLSIGERAAWSTAVARHGLSAKVGEQATLDLARDLVRLSREGLIRRGFGEERLLEPVDGYLSAGRSPADVLRARAGDVEGVIDLTGFS